MSSHHVCPNPWPSGAITRARARCVEDATRLATLSFAQIPEEQYGHYIEGRLAAVDTFTCFAPLPARRVQGGMSPKNWVKDAILKNRNKKELLAQLEVLRGLKDDVFAQIHVEINSLTPPRDFWLGVDFLLWSKKYEDFFDKAEDLIVHVIL